MEKEIEAKLPMEEVVIMAKEDQEMEVLQKVLRDPK